MFNIVYILKNKLIKYLKLSVHKHKNKKEKKENWFFFTELPINLLFPVINLFFNVGTPFFIRLPPELLPVLGPTLDMALLCGFRAGSDLGHIFCVTLTLEIQWFLFI